MPDLLLELFSEEIPAAPVRPQCHRHEDEQSNRCMRAESTDA
jgi:hypothetical protein